MALRPPLELVLRTLLAESAHSHRVTLERMIELLGGGVTSAEALDRRIVELGGRGASRVEAEALVEALKRADRTVDSPGWEEGLEAWGIMNATASSAARILREEGGTASSIAIASRLGIPVDDVQHALGKVRY